MGYGVKGNGSQILASTFTNNTILNNCTNCLALGFLICKIWMIVSTWVLVRIQRNKACKVLIRVSVTQQALNKCEDVVVLELLSTPSNTITMP